MGTFHIILSFHCLRGPKYYMTGTIQVMKDARNTKLGWWTDKPEREPRASSFNPISGPFLRRRPEKVWVKATLFVALMVGFGWSLLNLARTMA